MSRPVTLHLSDAVADSVERHPEIARLAERFVEEQVALQAWREGRFPEEVQELVRLGLQPAPDQEGTEPEGASVERLMTLLERADVYSWGQTVCA